MGPFLQTRRQSALLRMITGPPDLAISLSRSFRYFQEATPSPRSQHLGFVGSQQMKMWRVADLIPISLTAFSNFFDIVSTYNKDLAIIILWQGSHHLAQGGVKSAICCRHKGVLSPRRRALFQDPNRLHPWRLCQTRAYYR